jgi:hypothetical protein
MSSIKLFYHGPNKGKVNFGDALNPIIVREVTGREVSYSSIFRCEMIAIGSILDTFFRWRRVRSIIGSQKPVKVWGSGFIKAGGARDPEGLQLMAVRGPMTRVRLGLPPDFPLGDPGLLVRDFMTRNIRPKYAWGVVPHMSDIADPKILSLIHETRHATLIRLDDDPLQTLAKIADCEFVVSTSLHGLITADALGIPNWWFKAGNRVIGGDWKFQDYFASIERIDRNPIPFPPGGNLAKMNVPFDLTHFNNIPNLCQILRAVLVA